MTNIHFLSDTLRKNSGFANVSKNIMLELISRGYECSLTGLNSAYQKTWDYDIESYPISEEHISEVIKYTTNLMESKPDIIFNIFASDTGDMDSLLEIPFRCGLNKNLWYPPVDGFGLSSNSISSLRNFSKNRGKIIAQCKWGYNQMLNHDIDVVDYIYHGYNESIFKKLDKKEKLKNYCWFSTNTGKTVSNPKTLCKYSCYFCDGNNQECDNFKEEQVGLLRWDTTEKIFIYKHFPVISLHSVCKGKYVFGFVGANFGVRKRIERLIEAYSMLISNRQLKDRTLLWLHTIPVSSVGIDLLSIIKKFGIENNVVISYGGDRGSGLSEEAMCRIYNCFDCNVSASSGEGFGLPTLESMACGVPQIGTNICSFPELIGENGERGLLVDCELQMISDGYSIGYECSLTGLNSAYQYRGLINIKKLSESMLQIYNENKNNYSEKCINFSSQHTWSKVVDKWVKYLD